MKTERKKVLRATNGASREKTEHKTGSGSSFLQTTHLSGFTMRDHKANLKMTKLLTILCLTLGFAQGFAQSGEVFTTNDGAIRGYDPVAYFAEGKAVKGKGDLSIKWHDALWHFSSKENLESFKSMPEKYAPQYGGYCAFGTSEGHKAPTEPSAFTVVNGKLYLNYSADVKKMWLENQSERIRKADEYWPEVKKQ